jgi:antitoxin (DNA-binding transcriptional repressor) of toxin-antitoxin stability system
VKTLTSTEFKTKCLSILDEVAGTGKPVAQLVPLVPRAEGYPQHQIIGTVRVKGDIIEPPLPADAWEAERRDR